MRARQLAQRTCALSSLCRPAPAQQLGKFSLPTKDSRRLVNRVMAGPFFTSYPTGRALLLRTKLAPLWQRSILRKRAAILIAQKTIAVSERVNILLVASCERDLISCDQQIKLKV